MIVKHGKGNSEYGPGVDIILTGDEVATAISAYLVARNVVVSGPRTITVNGELCDDGRVYVDPSGFVIKNGEKFNGSVRSPRTEDKSPMGDTLAERACVDIYLSHHVSDVPHELRQAFDAGSDIYNSRKKVGQSC